MEEEPKNEKPKKTSTHIRIGEWRNRIIGDNYEKMMDLCEYYKRKPSDLIMLLIDQEHKKINTK